ncbi:MAG: 4Fe-4S binding protein [Lachnospiraceae bacterium]|nr:4Fe-4S binding protein [Lachnospiraceae bacterium]
MTPVQKKRIHTYVRAGIQLLFFILLPSAFTTAFAGVKYIFTRLGVREPIEMNSFVLILCVLLAYTIMFGRFFCGYACAFGSLGDAVRAVYLWICKKRKKKPLAWKESWSNVLVYLKYMILFAIILLCFLGKYSTVRGSSPWDVFSMLIAGNFKLGAYGIGTLLLLVIVIGMACCERFFCRFCCPMGAVFALMPVLPACSLQRTREECVKGCSGCKRVCPSDLDLPEAGTPDISGECFQCGKCMHVCPKQNVRHGVIPKKLELFFTLIRTALLAALLVWAGV